MAKAARKQFEGKEEFSQLVGELVRHGRATTSSSKALVAKQDALRETIGEAVQSSSDADRKLAGWRSTRTTDYGSGLTAFRDFIFEHLQHDQSLKQLFENNSSLKTDEFFKARSDIYLKKDKDAKSYKSLASSYYLAVRDIAAAENRVIDFSKDDWVQWIAPTLLNECKDRENYSIMVFLLIRERIHSGDNPETKITERPDKSAQVNTEIEGLPEEGAGKLMEKDTLEETDSLRPVFSIEATPEVIGARLRAARLQKGWTQLQLAQAMGLKSKRTVQNLEKGGQKDGGQTVAAIRAAMEALEISEI